MQLSKFSDYSFRALIYLAKHSEALCTVDELANSLKTSEHHMKKVVYKLATEGYIVSTKGRKGGIRLNKKPEEMNLGEILKITEDNMNIFMCYNSDDCPLLSEGCKLKKISHDALTCFIDEFSKHTLSDLLK